MRLICFMLLIGAGLFFTAPSKAQTYTKYWVEFTDKQDSPYSIDRPEAFLSPRALARRVRYNIPIKENDLPVSPSYIQELKTLNANVLYASKWLNGTIIELVDSNVLVEILALPFVANALPTSKKQRFRRQNSKKLTSIRMKKEEQQFSESEIYYGHAFDQLQMLNGDYLHAQGYRGEGMYIAVMDAGFINVDEIKAFEHLFLEGRLLGTKDFVEGDKDVFAHGSHGTHVLSTMAANQIGVYVGTAPEASYWLFRTEDGSSETRIEEYNWLAAAELADSVGVDIINTSLGYSLFDSPDMNYDYADMNGNTTVISRAAAIASEKGMLVVSSAGNQGNKPWKYITAPADGEQVLTVGAVNNMEAVATFTSYGPSADGRVKPNVSALGLGTTLIGTNGQPFMSNGTSYSAPIITGLAACLWQTNKRKTNMEVLAALERSANQRHRPDDRVGYGLPNFNRASFELTNPEILRFDQEAVSFIYPNPFSETADMYYYSKTNETISLILTNLAGHVLAMQTADVRADNPYKFTFEEWRSCAKGIYLIQITNGIQQKTLKAVKLG